jgi:hypothetical protein
MEIYIKKSDGTLKPVALRDALAKAIAKGMGVKTEDVEMDVDRHSDGSGSWVEVSQNTEDNSTQITVSIWFDDDGNNVEDIKVYKTPVKTIVDSDNIEELI